MAASSTSGLLAVACGRPRELERERRLRPTEERTLDADLTIMQVADVQLFDAAGTGIFAPGDTILGVQVDGALVPEPSTGLLAFLGLAGLLRRRR